MKTNMKKTLIGFASILLAVAIILIAPISRLVYGIYDADRTKKVLAQLEAEANAPQQEAEVNNFHKQAYLSTSQETDGGKTVETVNLLVLTSESGYELNYYERIVEGEKSYTAEYFRMTGTYTREGNMLTVAPGIGVLAQSMDGSFVVGGTSDAAEELPAPAGRNVYTDYVAQGRKTYKTLVILEDGTYYVYSQATNSNNEEQTTGALFGYSTYVIKDTDKGIVPDETMPEQTYDIVTGEPGIGYMYANNNGSHMHFDLQTHAGFLSWLATNFNASSPTFYVSESGFTMKIGALKTVINPWGLYIPAADAGNAEQEEEQTAVTGVTLELETSVEGKPFILQLNGDGTLVTGWTNYEQTLMEGTWSIVDGALALDVAYESTVTANADGSLTIVVNYGQMGEKTYTMTAAQFAGLQGVEAPEVTGVTLELETSVEGKPFILQLNGDGTLVTGWTNYEQTLMEGTWSIVDGALVLDVAYESAVTANADGSLTIVVNYGQMGEKTYTMTAAQFAGLQGVEAPAVTGVTLELETSVEGKPFILQLNGDGTLVTGWTNYEQTLMEGTWSIVDGALVLDVAYESTVTANADGSLTIVVNYGQMGEKTYTMTADQFAGLQGVEAPAATGVTLELETSVEGKPFILQLNGDGTLVTGWTNYEQTLMEGTWSIVDGALVLDVAYESTVTANADGSLTIVVNYGQMGEKTYTMTADQAKTILH